MFVLPVVVPEKLFILWFIKEQTFLEHTKLRNINNPCRELQTINKYQRTKLSTDVAIKENIQHKPIISASFKLMRKEHRFPFVVEFNLEPRRICLAIITAVVEKKITSMALKRARGTMKNTSNAFEEFIQQVFSPN
jgi:hypothetical protein